jgi:hypothetical protein
MFLLQRRVSRAEKWFRVARPELLDSLRLRPKNDDLTKSLVAEVLALLGSQSVPATSLLTLSTLRRPRRSSLVHPRWNIRTRGETCPGCSLLI